MKAGGDPTQQDRLPVFALLVANIVSLIGNSLTAVALPWFVLQTTGSAAQAGLVGFAQLLPAFVAGILGGSLVDTFGYKRMSVAADVVSGLAIGAVPLLYHTLGLAFWQLLVLVFIGAVLDVPGLTARRSALPELAKLAGIPLPRINASYEATQHIAWLLGPPLAGVLVALLGATNVMWVDAATFAVSAGAVAVAVPRIAPVRAAVQGHWRDELLAGLRFIRRDRVLLAMAVVLAISNGLAGSMFAVVLPVFADDVFGSATDLGLMFAAGGVGSLIGVTLYGSVGLRIPRRWLWLLGFGISPIDWWVLSLEPSLPVVIAALVVTGVVTGPINPLMVTVRHERSPAELRGRVFASYSAIALAAQPLGMVLAGSLIEGVGFTPTILLFALAQQALAVGMIFVPAFRSLEEPAPEQHRLAAGAAPLDAIPKVGGSGSLGRWIPRTRPRRRPPRRKTRPRSGRWTTPCGRSWSPSSGSRKSARSPVARAAMTGRSSTG